MYRNQQPESPIRDEYDLLALWTKVLPAIGTERRTLAVVFLDEDRCPIPTLVPIDDLPAEPDRALVDSFAKMFRILRLDVLGESLVLLLSRPGENTPSPQDLRWAAAVEGLSDWPLFLATGSGIQLLQIDDLEDTASFAAHAKTRGS